MTTREDLVDGGHRWLRCSRPFPYVIAHDAFRPEVYESLDAQFREWLARGLRDEPAGTDTVFSRAMGSYDAYGYNFSQPFAGAFDVLLSRAWCGLLADLFRLKDTHHVNLGLHHHLPHSASGWAHTDLAPGWFADDQPGPDEMTLSDHSRVDYHSGQVLVPDVRAVEEVRAVAVLLYLANDEWRPGDGGETALFSGSEGRPDQVAARVPPVNNTMLAFECSPYSFHTFLSNTRTPRNCLVMWLHRPKEEAVQRWGEQSIVYWRR